MFNNTSFISIRREICSPNDFSYISLVSWQNHGFIYIFFMMNPVLTSLSATTINYLLKYGKR